MEPQYNPQETEKEIYRFWEEGGFFNPDNIKSDKKFCITIPPPNVTGSLHMGHALNACIQDVLIRQKRMQGFKTLWLAGTDHAGIATQNVVEKKLKKEGKSRFDLGREEFVKRIWAWKEEYGDIILAQLKTLGASCDWSRVRFTMDDRYTKAVQESFLKYFEKGWIYRGKRVINWCPRCQTSLSDLELEYKEEKSNLWFIKYPIVGEEGKFVIVATTRPETMLGDTAVAINPEDERYKGFVGKKLVLPLVDREIPIVEDRLIDKEFGTGAVKVTPAHDLTDYEIGQKNNLEIIQVIDEKARMNENAPEKYRGLKTKEAREKIVEDLNQAGLIEKIEEYNHEIPKCYRCDSDVQLIPSEQWFVKMTELAKAAAAPVEEGKIKFHPERWRDIYLNWLKTARDWCISRQIWWGHRLPVWFCEKEEGKYFVSIENPEKCQVCGSCEPRQSEDVFDTWFSSALWPFATLGWPEKTKDLEEFYPTDVLSTARDIINLWVARMVFSGIQLAGDI
ncbi:MAG: valine--tRNA ligase, partial [Candidatus Portnoybacteria bacterium]|nr:valine--tRNA ligase [Candidatus Portnoybacteria bacterium]